MSGPFRSRGTSHATATATTTAAAVAIPSGTTSLKIEALTGDLYVGVGASGTAPALGTSNSVVIGNGDREVWTFDIRHPVDTHLYIAAVTATAEYRLSFYG